MKKVFKFFLLGFGLLVILIVGAGIIAVHLDPDTYKSFIITKVKEQTGRDLVLNGPIKLGVYPWIHIEISDMTLQNAKGFGEQPFFHADHIKIRVKTLPLLKKQVQMDVIQIQGARINLAKNKQGITNWDDLMQGSAEQKTSSSSDPGMLAALALGGLDIQDAGLVWDDQAAGVNYQVTHLNISTNDLVLGEPIDLKMTFNAAASRPKISGDAALHGTIVYNLDAKQYGVKSFQFESVLKGKNIPGGQTRLTLMSGADINLGTDTATISDMVLDILDTHVTGHMTAARFRSGKPSIKGGLHMAGKDLALLFQVAEIEPLAGQLARLKDRSFDIRADLDADMEKGDADLTGLTVAMLGAEIKGEAHAGNIQSKTPSFKGHFSAVGPDLPALIQVAGQFEPGPDPKIKPLGQHLSKIKQKAFNVATRFDADFKTGIVTVPVLKINALGINMESSLEAVDVQSKTPSVKGSFTAAGPDLPLLLEVGGFFEQGENQSMRKFGRQLSKLGDKAFDMGTRFDVDLKQGLINIPEISAKAMGITIAGKLTGENIDKTNGKMDGHLTINGNNLTRLFKAIEQAELAEVLTSVSVDAGISGNINDLNLNPLGLTAVLSGKQIPNSPVKIELNAATRVNLEKQTIKIDSLSLSGLGLNVKGNINAQQIINDPVFDGSLQVAQFNLRKLFAQLNQPLPQTSDNSVLKKVALQADFSGSKSRMDIKKINILLDDTTMKGDFLVNEFANPDIRFDLNIGKLNADRYLPPPQKDEKGAGPQKGETAASGKSKQKEKTASKGTPAVDKPQGLPMETLRALKIKGDVSIGELIISRAKLENIHVKLDAIDGNIKMAPITADLYTGKYTGDIFLDATKKMPAITLNADLKGIQAEPLLNDVTGNARLRGKGNFNAALTTAGQDVQAMKKSLNGKMSFSFKDGAVKGFNVGKFLRSLKSVRENSSYKVSDEEETDFAELTGNPTIKNGLVTLNDLDGRSPAFRLQGKGLLADLVNEKIDYTAGATVVETSKGQAGKDLAQLNGITIPIHIKGGLKNPKIEPDIRELIKSLAAKGIIDKLGLKIPGLTPQKQTGATEQPDKQQLKKADPNEEIKNKLNQELGNIFKKVLN